MPPPKSSKPSRRWRRLALVAIGGPALLFPGLPPHSPTASPVTIPFTLEEARLYVAVTTADGHSRSFILDTGASPTMLDAAVARELGLRVTGGEAVRGAGTGSTVIREADDVTLRIGGTTLRLATVRVAPLDSLLGPHTGRRIDGIVGSQFFAEHVVEVDFDAGVLRLYPPRNYRYTGRGLVIPVELWGGVPIAPGRLALPGGRTVPARMLVDLGAKANALLNEPFIARYRLDSAISGGTIATLGAGIGGETRYRFARLPGIVVGDDARVGQESLVVGLSIAGTLRATAYDVLLGTGFLERYRLIIDHARRRHIYEPRPVPPVDAAFDMSGMYLLAGRHPSRSIRVLRVEPGSPAHEAGLRAGDEILRVGGRSAAALTLSEARAILRSGDGRRIDVEYRRDDLTARVTLVLRRLV